MRSRKEDLRATSNGLPPPPGGYYYSSTGTPSSRIAPSPATSHHTRTELRPHQQHLPPHTNGFHLPPTMVPPPPSTPRSRMEGTPRGADDSTPSYSVEHLVTFAVSRQYGLVTPSDGVRKLKDMEKKSAIWAQPMVLRLRPNVVAVEEENGELVESFPMQLIEKPTAHTSNDPREQYNNMLIFVVNEDARAKRAQGNRPTEMHIFQCNRVAATEVADDLQKFIRGQSQEVRPGRRSSGAYGASAYQAQYGGAPFAPQYGLNDDASISSDTSEMFERDVNTLNRCFDDIERFVARIQAAAIAQRELEEKSRRYRTAQRRDKRSIPPPDPHGILYMRSRVPNEPEFVDILKKFKLSFNLLAKLKNHIHEPNAPELLHFLFTPLSVILDACHWGLGRNIAPQVVSPLLALETRELMQNCLTSKETDIWMRLGDAWRTPPEDWTGPLPAPYRPVFVDGFAPYGLPEAAVVPVNATPTHHSSSSLHHSFQQQPPPLHRGESAPPSHYRGREDSQRTSGPRGNNEISGSVPSTPAARRSVSSTYVAQPPSRDNSRHRHPRNLSVDNLDLDRISFERERVEFEKMMLEKERRLLEEEKSLRAEKARLEAERRLIHEESERRSINSNNIGNQQYSNNTSMLPSPMLSQGQNGRQNGHTTLDTVDGGAGSAATNAGSSPREKAFIDDMMNRRCKIVQATYDRTSMNAKELSVHRGEYLEVLNDAKNWWECKNMHNRVGYVPHTILTVTSVDQFGRRDSQDQEIYSHTKENGGMGYAGPPSSSGAPRSHPSPRPDPSRFHITSEVGIQADIHQGKPRVAPAPQPRSTIPEPPGPPPSMQALEVPRTPKASEKAQQLPKITEEHQSSKPVLVIKRRQEEEDLYQQMKFTLSRTEGAKLQSAQRPLTVQLSDKSTAKEVATWLEEKGFSPRTIDVLSEQDGANLFCLSRANLIEVCGKEEGSRLYSQMLVQKKRSGYQTLTGAELKAILNYRKTNVDQRNEASSEEPNLPPVQYNRL